MPKKILTIILSCLLLNIAAFARLKGIITDKKTGEPLQAASVKIKSKSGYWGHQADGSGNKHY